MPPLKQFPGSWELRPDKYWVAKRISFVKDTPILSETLVVCKMKSKQHRFYFIETVWKTCWNVCLEETRQTPVCVPYRQAPESQEVPGSGIAPDIHRLPQICLKHV